MARPFNVNAARSTFELPLLTRQQIKALLLDMDMDAREVVIRAVAELHRRDLGPPARDVFAELDAINAKLGMA